MTLPTTKSISKQAHYGGVAPFYPGQEYNREEYATIHENGYKDAIKDPLSTFSVIMVSPR